MPQSRTHRAPDPGMRPQYSRATIAAMSGLDMIAWAERKACSSNSLFEHLLQDSHFWLDMTLTHGTKGRKRWKHVAARWWELVGVTKGEGGLKGEEITVMFGTADRHLRVFNGCDSTRCARRSLGQCQKTRQHELGTSYRTNARNAPSMYTSLRDGRSRSMLAD